MVGLTEVEKDKLPIRPLRGTKTNANTDVNETKDPFIIGWRALKKGKWSSKRSVRHAGLQYAIERCIEVGTKKEDLNEIFGDAFNRQALKNIIQ